MIFFRLVVDRNWFGSKWRMWITGCPRLANFLTMINGRPREHFGATRGLRQGDPLSLSLFTLVVDVMSRLVEKAVWN